MARQRSDAKTSHTTTTTTSGGTPPYYIATRPLYIGGNPFARAHQAGDRVPVEHVDLYGWQHGVRPPDGWETPAPPSKPSSKPTTSEPESGSGQATSTKEGDA